MTATANQPVRTSRLLLSALVVGLILNMGEAALHGGVLAAATEAAYRALGRAAPVDPLNLVSLVVLTFVQGGVMAWLYVTVRPRFGARFKTAACVGLLGWLLSSVYSAVYLNSGFPGVLPANLIWTPVAWQLIEYPLAMIVGAALHRE